ncbi:hypothetical protein BH23GEM2_BH23GEM2_18430 [soil metagenome]
MDPANRNRAPEHATGVAQREGWDVSPTDLEALFQQAPAFFAVLRGPSHVFERVNESYLQLIAHRDVIGKPVLEALPEIRGQGFDALLDGVLATGVPFVGRAVPVTIIRTPGSAPEQLSVDFIYHSLCDASGKPTGIIAHGTDVTEQVVARREAEEASSRVIKVLSSLTDAVCVFDRAWRAVYVNPAAADVLRTLGKDPERFIGRVLWDELPELLGTAFETESKRAGREERVVEYEEFMPAIGRWLENRVVPSPERITTFSRDIYDRRRAQ